MHDTGCLNAHGFADIFGTTADLLPQACLEKIRSGRWDYEILRGRERDAVMLDIFDRIEQRKLTVVANEDKSRWQKGWAENLDAFRQTGGDVAALDPKYIRKALPLRFRGEFIRTADEDFERHWYEIFREWFFLTYLQGFDHIFEFGCGSGFNVAELARLYPQADIHGLDWAQPAIDIVNDLRERKKLNVQGRTFDFFHPDDSLEIPANSAVLTIVAIEQTGEDWGQFLDFLLAKKPRCVFHIEPVYEWYDQANMVDRTAAVTHKARNYLFGYARKLIELQQQGRVKILRTKRTGFGSLMNEGYSQIIWAPV